MLEYVLYRPPGKRTDTLRAVNQRCRILGAVVLVGKVRLRHVFLHGGIAVLVILAVVCPYEFAVRINLDSRHVPHDLDRLPYILARYTVEVSL